VIGKDHAAFLAVEVFVSSINRNILCPLGAGGGT